MVYIHFPNNLTEEEQMLQAKYQKLKKKKKALQAHKAPKPEPESSLTLKRPTDARDAREVARKLIKSGAIPAIQKQQTKQDQTSFKRPKGQERAKRSTSETTVASYQPFSSTQNDVAQETIISEIIKEEPRRQNLYQHFATERDREERVMAEKAAAIDTPPPEKPRAGNTIFVSGNKVTEDFLKKTFNDYGTIVNVSMEIEKSRGFVSFAKPESADRAIAEMHGKNVTGIVLQVQLARRQPQIEPINDASSSAVWSSIAASKSQKGSHKDHREMVKYNDDFLL
ncbi:GL10297 [Drosophila persimilis]|uniref:Negative elongation factor E n=2 Tax=pseudoobscura subgroup TaxID=32358 RepID=Q29D00_DROPS|nr:negative elongation factor E isoform X2 [Drosophila pseudoobscura]XP_002027512.1 negative elongation factor E [Drosophila persimilis]XP_017137374.1 negative elongation factor E [Drosophila miranda]EDW36456.1 GL10297 [Drosophila persimilis]